jgi:hypothetical protein
MVSVAALPEPKKRFRAQMTAGAQIQCMIRMGNGCAGRLCVVVFDTRAS